MENIKIEQKKLQGIEGAIKQHEALKILGVSMESLSKLTIMDSVNVMSDLNELLKKHNLKIK